MFDWFLELNPVSQALFALILAWFTTTAGAASVFFLKTFNQKVMDGMLGFAGGIMIAASFWSLLEPSLEMSEGGSMPVWLPSLIGFLVGGICLKGVDFFLPGLYDRFIGKRPVNSESFRRSTMLVSAITLHNIPEALAVGVAFGAVASGVEGATIGGALALTIAISIQNVPEGMAVSFPLRREGISRFWSFFWGQFSAIVFPLAGIAGAFLVLAVQPALPYALSFAAGAMIFVVIDEIIPEAQSHGNRKIATTGGMIGFAFMMVLDVGLE